MLLWSELPKSFWDVSILHANRLRKHVQVVMVSRGNLLEKMGIGREGGGWWEGSGREGERGGKKRWGRGVSEGSGGKGGGGGKGRGNQADGGAEGGGKRQNSRRPVDAGVVAFQPRKPEHQLEVTQPGHLEGEFLGMRSVNA